MSLATQKSLSFGPGQELQYEGDATTEDAQRVGDELVELGFLGPEQNASTVDLSRKKDHYKLGFYVQEGAWNDPATVDAFLCISASVRERALGKKRVTVELLDDFATAKKTADASLTTDAAHAKRCGVAEP